MLGLMAAPQGARMASSPRMANSPARPPAARQGHQSTFVDMYARMRRQRGEQRDGQHRPKHKRGEQLELDAQPMTIEASTSRIGREPSSPMAKAFTNPIQMKVQEWKCSFLRRARGREPKELPKKEPTEHNNEPKEPKHLKELPKQSKELKKLRKKSDK